MLPYVKVAFEKASEEFERHLPDGLDEGLCEMLRWTCEPDPEVRGVDVPGERLGEIAIQKIVSRFDLMARRF